MLFHCVCNFFSFTRKDVFLKSASPQMGQKRFNMTPNKTMLQRFWKQQKKCLRLHFTFTKIFFYIQPFHWLNVLWSFGLENTGLSVCLSVCLTDYLPVCASVRLSLCATTPKLLGWFQWNFLQMVPYGSVERIWVSAH